MVDSGSSPEYRLTACIGIIGSITTYNKALINIGAFLFRNNYLHLYMPDKIQQAYDRIVAIAESSPTKYRYKVREILLSLGAKETPVNKDKKCNA